MTVRTLLSRLAVSRLSLCQRGSSGIEFALTGGVVAIAFCMAVEVCGYFYAQHTVQTAANQAVRFAATGAVPQAPGASRDQQVLDIIAGATRGLVTPQAVTDIAESFPSFSALEAGGGGTPGLGGPDQVVAIELSVPWQGYTPVFGLFAESLTVHARVAARNETFEVGGV
ncbi:MAG: pilus assembly protein [Alphaproteobacteria bacterium]|nr:pilus assembly protein [Alphaproteobacteria bacterium]